MRDRSAPHKRASLKEQGKASPSLGGLNVYGNDSLSFPTSSSTSNSYHIPSSHSSDASTSPPASSSSIKINGTQVDPQRLLDLYYKYVCPILCYSGVEACSLDAEECLLYDRDRAIFTK